MINATYNGQTYQDVTTLVASDGTNSATVTLTESSGGGSVGDFSNATTINVTTTDVTKLVFENPYGTGTKLIVVKATIAPSSGISEYIAQPSFGCCHGINKSTGNVATQGSTPQTTGYANNTFEIGQTTWLYQSGTNLQWDTNTEYVVTVYA